MNGQQREDLGCFQNWTDCSCRSKRFFPFALVHSNICEHSSRALMWNTTTEPRLPWRGDQFHSMWTLEVSFSALITQPTLQLEHIALICAARCQYFNIVMYRCLCAAPFDKVLTATPLSIVYSRFCKHHCFCVGRPTSRKCVHLLRRRWGCAPPLSLFVGVVIVVMTLSTQL